MPSMRGRIAPWGSRLKWQLVSLAAFNSYFWAPAGKYLCLPVFNCYACPAAAVSCPIGSLTAFALVRQIPYYIIGTLGLVGVSVGRAFCGWLCPFGFLQDALYRLPTPKLRWPRPASWLKYAMLLVLVLGIPYLRGGGRDAAGSDRVVTESTGAIDYCALFCPAGTLEAGVPGLVANPGLRDLVTWRTWSKLGIMFAVLALMVFARRSFCRGFCPLGALMALTSRLSRLRLHTDHTACTHCQRCVRVCPTEARTVPATASAAEATAECVLCLDCVRACPEQGALAAMLSGKTIMRSRGRLAPAPVLTAAGEATDETT
jgi:ferredoxin-type protein NapH